MPETKEQQYKRIGFGKRLGFGEKPAVLVVDIQKAFTDPTYALGGNFDDMVENSIKVINLAKEKNVPVIYTRVAYEGPDLADMGIWGQKNTDWLGRIRVGSKWAELDDRMPYEAGKDFLITKKMFSAFFGTPLILILQHYRIDTVITLGDSTSGCVRSTVNDGLNYGYRMMIPLECVGDRSKEAHEASIFDMDNKMADVVSLEATINYLKGLK